MSSDEKKGSTAQVLNIRAAKAIVDTVKTTLGPMGMDKMMVDGIGNVIITNDGATILRELDVAHPGAKMMVEVAKTQESLCYDGTTSTVVLAGQLLSNSEALFEKGLHPNVICRGYHEASQMAVHYLETVLGIHGSDVKILERVGKTAITGKTVENALDKVSNLCVEAVVNAGDIDKVRVVSLPGGSLDDSYLFKGTIINKDFLLGFDCSEETSVLLINTGLEKEKEEDNVQIQVDAASYSKLKQSTHDNLLSKAIEIVALMGEGGVVFVRDSVHDSICAYLKKHNIGVVRRVSESTMRALSNTVNIPIAQTVDDIDSVGIIDITREKHDDVYYLFVEGKEDNDQSTLILRGATPSTLDEIERGFDDALGVISLVLNNQSVVTGGGSAYLAMAVYLRNHAATTGGRAQMAIEAFADALEAIPATIAENAGHDPLDTVLGMRHEVQGGNFFSGPDVSSGNIISMLDNGVFEPTELVRQAVLGATEVTTSILRIDDIVSRKQIE